jgi:hypothetical protein
MSSIQVEGVFPPPWSARRGLYPSWGTWGEEFFLNVRIIIISLARLEWKKSVSVFSRCNGQRGRMLQAKAVWSMGQEGRSSPHFPLSMDGRPGMT